MARERFKTTRVLIKQYPTDKRITSVTIEHNTTTKRAYTIVFGKKVYLTEQETHTLDSSITISFE